MEEQILISSGTTEIKLYSKKIARIISSIYIACVIVCKILLEELLLYVMFGVGFPILIYICLLVYYEFFRPNNNITVTNKRIYGRCGKGKQVDLPIDSVSAVSYENTFAVPKNISVSTPSGQISFSDIKNYIEVYEVINKLLLEGQEHKNTQSVPSTSTSNADELKKFKELLDSGVITQEEFDKKKRELLGL